MPGPRAVRTAVADRPLVAYAVLAVGLSWSWWVPVALTGGTASHFPGLLGPLVAAVVVAGATGGTAGLRRLAGGLGRPRWWALALAPLAVGAGAVALLRAVGRGPEWEELAEMPGLPAWPWAGVFVAVLVLNGVGEEAGWRGLAWPRLRARLGQRDAALVLTVAWAVWHLPLFWLESGLAGLSLLVLPGWLVGLAAGAVVLGWLYERSGSEQAPAPGHVPAPCR